MYYRGIGPERGIMVDEESAYDYAKNHLDEMPEKDKQLFVDFYFSGNWIKEHKMKSRNQRNYEIMEGLRDESI